MEYSEYSIRDRVRTYKVYGTILAESSSQEYDKARWVEFKLFKTQKNQYVLSRIGVSVLYHAGHCRIVSRNKLSAVDGNILESFYIPCSKCQPTIFDEDGVYPETNRYFALVSETARGILAALMQKDDNGIMYLTDVAQDLLQEAAEKDQEIADVLFINYVD